MTPDKFSPHLQYDENSGRVNWSNGVHIGDVYMEVDGYYVFTFAQGRVGSWESFPLREIADLLDKLNQKWDDEIRKFFDEQQ